MPKVDWGISADTVDDFDRESGYKPYTGKIPPNGVYQWRVQTLKFIAGTKTKTPQLRAGLVLVSRDQDEKKFDGYFVTKFMNVGENNAFVYTPFLDAIGVTGTEFVSRTLVDEEGTVKRIGNWRNDQQTLILGQLRDKEYNGTTFKEVNWVGPLEEAETEDEYDEEDYDEDGEAEESEEEEEYEDDGF